MASIDEFGFRDAPLGPLLGVPAWPFALDWPQLAQEIEGAALCEHEARLAEQRGDHYEAHDCRQLAEQYRRGGGYGN